MLPFFVLRIFPFLFLVEAVTEIENKIKQLKLANQKLARNSRAGTMYETVQETGSKTTSDMAKVEETLLFTREVVDNSSAITPVHNIFGVLVSVIIVLFSRILY